MSNRLEKGELRIAVADLQKLLGGRIGFSISKLVEILGPRRSWWYEQIAKGNLEAVKFGKRTIVLAPALAAFLDALPTAHSTYIRQGTQVPSQPAKAGGERDRFPAKPKQVGRYQQRRTD